MFRCCFNPNAVDTKPFRTSPSDFGAAMDGSDHASEKKKNSGVLPAEVNDSATSCKLELLDGDPMDFPRPANEKQRLDKLRKMDAFSRKPDDCDRFDHITMLMKNVFKVDLAAVTLIDEEVIRCRSLTIAPPESITLPRKQFPCSWSLLEERNDVLCIEDMSKDPRTRKANLFSELYSHENGVKFYAGAPLLTSEGIRLGVLCILHKEPRKIHPSECMILVNFAEMVVRELERDELVIHRARALEEALSDNQRLVRAVESLNESLVVCNMSQDGWPIVLVNQALTKAIKKDRPDIEGKAFLEVFYSLNPYTTPESFDDAIRNRTTFAMTVAVKGQSDLVFEARFRPHTESYDINAAAISVAQADAASADYIKDTFYFITLVPCKLVTSGMNSNISTSGIGSALSVQAVSVGGLTPLADDVASIFSDIRLQKLLGKGAFGRVYKGFWDGAPVAVKILEHKKSALKQAAAKGVTINSEAGSIDSSSPGPGTSSRFNPLLEAILSVRLHSPNVIQSYKYASRRKPVDATIPEETDEDNELWETWIVQEYADMGTLQQLIDEGRYFRDAPQGSPSLPKIISVCQDITSGVSHLHEAKVLHGDLTANNVLLTSVGKGAVVAKVADFGLSQVLAGDQTVIKTDTFGTVTHMSPELLLEGRLTAAVDIYSLGVIMWQLLTGQRPFGQLNHAQIISAVLKEEFRLKFDSESPADYVAVAEKCMSREPADRPNASRLLELIQSAADSIVPHTP